MWERRTFEDWRRPHDQDVRVAFVTLARCPAGHRTVHLSATVVVDRTEDHGAPNAAALQELANQRVRQAERAVLRAVVPFRFRREMGVPR